MNSLLTAFLISIPSPLGYAPVIIHPPTVNLSAVRPIKCNEGSGTGFVIADDVLATALHVANATNCKDAETGVTLTTYHEDAANDFALMSGDYPNGGPFIKYSCGSFKVGKTYLSLGFRRMFRLDTLVATGQYSPADYVVSGMPMPGMHKFKGGIVFGMSGGVIFNPDDGKVHGINNVAAWDRSGRISETYSYELKNTILCKKPIPAT